MNTLDIVKAMKAIYVIEEGTYKGQVIEITTDLKVTNIGTYTTYQWNGEWSEKIEYTKYTISYRGEDISSAEGSAFDVLDEIVRALERYGKED